MTTRGKAEWTCAVDGCGNPAHERAICHRCAGQLTRHIAELPALLDELNTTLSRQARIGGHPNGSRSAERPLPYDHRASEAAFILRSTVVGWLRELHDGVERWPTESLYAMALWLHMRTPRLLDHPKAHEAVDEIGAATRYAHTIVDKPANRTTFTVGPCPEIPWADINDMTPCPGQVRAYIPTSEDRPCRMQCDTCRAVWHTWQWLRAGKRILDRIEAISA